MASVNNLTSKIISDAEEKKTSMLNEANEKRNATIAKKKDEAKNEETVILERAKREAQARKERIISGAELSARNEKLAAKQKVINEVFEKSLEELCKISDSELKEFVVNTVLNSNISGTQNLILNELGTKVVDESVVSQINEKLGSHAKLVLSNKTRQFKGGFILEKDGIEINNTFEALISSIKDDLGLEVAQVLFN